MITDLYDVKLDFTCTFLHPISLAHLGLSNVPLFAGRIIPTHIMIVVEFNMTIIAASVVVMRPCFQALFDIVFPMSVHASHNSSGAKKSGRGGRLDGYIMSPDENDSAPRRDGGAGIVKTVDIELRSKDASTEDILKGKLASTASFVLGSF
jgi:hypothetical protein